MTEAPTTTAPAAPAGAPPNLAGLAGWRLPLREFGTAIASGLLLSAAFAPLEWDLLAFVALVPLLWLPPPASVGRRAAIGYVFGLAHGLTNLWWLNTIGFAAGILLALICAFYPMLWYLGASALLRRWRTDRAAAAADTEDVPPPTFSMGRQCLLTLLLPALWVALEWVRGWLFTGFSWNQLGICQWQRLALIQVAQFTGVYGVSFLLVSINVALALTWRGMWETLAHRAPQRRSVALYLVAALLLPTVWQGRHLLPLGHPDAAVNIALVQGNIPQCRDWSQEELDTSLAVYTSLTRKAVASSGRPSLVVWPESAIPAPARFNEQYAAELAKLIPDIRTPLLIGTLDYRPPTPDTPQEDWPAYNSALLLDETGAIRAHYDKIHRVPFGEFVPFSRWFPWLVRWIGMGRDLTPGREYTIFDLPADIRGGVMICYEDAFGDLARQFSRRGADLLLTLTNDAWYAESAGARQHFTHAVFRAVENRRPLLRSGNNSDSGLILPNGRVQDLLVDLVTGSRFVRDFTTVTVPVWRHQPQTWYARHGDVFAQACTALAAGLAAFLLRDWFQGQRTRLQTITGEAPAAASPTSDKSRST